MPRRAGRTPSEVRENKIRAEQGLPSLATEKRLAKGDPRSILPESKKARAQQILAEMLTKKSKAVVQKIIDKALDDNDRDQMACLTIVMDRILPKDYITKSANKSGNISIQIIASDGAVNINEEEIQDAEYEVVDGSEE
jgi:hypothetical protein